MRIIRYTLPCVGAAVMAVMLDSPVLAQTATKASLFVVHGLPGRDVGPTEDPTLPVDVLVDGKYCLLRNLAFGSVAGPFELPAGAYTVAVSLANPIAPCSDPAVITARVTLSAGEYAAAVAALSTKGTPALEPFALDFSGISTGAERFISVHAADAAGVSVVANGSVSPPVTLRVEIGPGTARSDTVPSDMGLAGTFYAVTAQPTRGGAQAGPVFVPVRDRAAALVFAVGSAENGTLTLISRLIENVL